MIFLYLFAACYFFRRAKKPVYHWWFQWCTWLFLKVRDPQKHWVPYWPTWFFQVKYPKSWWFLVIFPTVCPKLEGISQDTRTHESYIILYNEIIIRAILIPMTSPFFWVKLPIHPHRDTVENQLMSIRDLLEAEDFDQSWVSKMRGMYPLVNIQKAIEHGHL
jgi:hypothetical protein